MTKEISDFLTIVGSILFLDPNTTAIKHVLTFHSLIQSSSTPSSSFIIIGQYLNQHGPHSTYGLLRQVPFEQIVEKITNALKDSTNTVSINYNGKGKGTLNTLAVEIKSKGGSSSFNCTFG
jgi:hypothetical protein